MYHTFMKNNLRKRTQIIIDILENQFPNATCSLNHTNPYQLLIATILSAQCTDKRVNMVTPALFKRYPDIRSMAKANIKELEELIKSTGFYKNKSKNIINCCKAIQAKYKGIVPHSINELTALSGIGRKTANVIMGTAFNIPSGIVVDTHVKRISKLIGLSSNNDPKKIENDLIKLIPEEKWIVFSHLLILHGRQTCKARSPLHNDCPIKHLCSYYLKELPKSR